MKSNIDELIETTTRLCESIDSTLANELKLCAEIQHYLDIMSWETYKMANELKLLRECYGT